MRHHGSFRGSQAKFETPVCAVGIRGPVVPDGVRKSGFDVDDLGRSDVEIRSFVRANESGAGPQLSIPYPAPFPLIPFIRWTQYFGPSCPIPPLQTAIL